MKSSISNVSILGLHDRQDIEVKLHPGLNIIHGKNGSGKTTFLHILANISEGDIGRFCCILFHKIRITNSTGSVLELQQIRNAGQVGVHVSIDKQPLCEIKEGDQIPDESLHLITNITGELPIYLPAFRSVLESIGETRPRRLYSESDRQRDAELVRLVEREEMLRRRDTGVERVGRRLSRRHFEDLQVANKTLLCRDWFGPFVPTVRFPSLNEVSAQLEEELREAQEVLYKFDRDIYSSVFVDVLNAVLDKVPSSPTKSVDKLLKDIKKSLLSLQSSADKVSREYEAINNVLMRHSESLETNEELTNRILQIYDYVLSKRIKTASSAFKALRILEDSVNSFLEGKSLALSSGQYVQARQKLGHIRIIDHGSLKKHGLSALSSGERHILTLLFSATHMASTGGMLLIDEPELSLHVDWQRVILGELMKQAGDRQIIVCTHAPEVTADHRKSMLRLKAVVREPSSGLTDLIDEYESEEDV
jgi:predicted ATP-binding protein involved in virulence